MDKQAAIWTLKPHTAAKHAILRRYLEAWFPKLSWKGRVVFIDGFAGPGEYSNGEPGSPLIAIKAATEHKYDLSNCELVYLFVEQDRRRYEHLNLAIARTKIPPHVKCQTVHGTFSEQVGGILDRLDREGKSLAPAFIMLDPFGFSGMPFSVVRRIAAQPRSELLISFMYESITRWRSQPQLARTLDLLFGCPDWRHADSIANRMAKKRFLVDLYVSQLRDAGIDYVRTFEMLDEGNRTEYFLVFATHSIEGLKAMKDAMWKADPSGLFRFSDATVSSQLTLISPAPDFDQLGRLVLARFAGSEVSVEDVELFVLVETAFRETHYKRQILTPMEQAGKLTVVKSPRKRPGSYPAGTVMRFALAS